MKIDRSIPDSARLPIEGKETGARVQRSETPAQSQSPAAITHLNQGSEASAAQDIDLKRVAEIRQAISEGRLELRPERIADGLLANVRELLDGGGS